MLLPICPACLDFPVDNANVSQHVDVEVLLLPHFCLSGQPDPGSEIQSYLDRHDTGFGFSKFAELWWPSKQSAVPKQKCSRGSLLLLHYTPYFTVFPDRNKQMRPCSLGVCWREDAQSTAWHSSPSNVVCVSVNNLGIHVLKQCK